MWHLYVPMYPLYYQQIYGISDIWMNLGVHIFSGTGNALIAIKCCRWLCFGACMYQCHLQANLE